jgi:hypothetical protein
VNSFRHRRKLADSIAEGLVLRVLCGEPVRVVARDLAITHDTALIYCYRAGVVPRYLRKPRMKTLFLSTMILSVLVAPPVGAACVVGSPGTLVANLNIVAPTTNADGTPLTLPLTYNIYQGTASGAEVKVSSNWTSSGVINLGLVAGNTYYWQVSAVDANGEGARSAEMCKSFKAPASPPGSVTLSVT